jgi:hypothetical protein
LEYSNNIEVFFVEENAFAFEVGVDDLFLLLDRLHSPVSLLQKDLHEVNLTLGQSFHFLGHLEALCLAIRHFQATNYFVEVVIWGCGQSINTN